MENKKLILDSATVSWLRRKIHPLRHKKNLVRHSLGMLTWPTKSYEIWLLLQNLLYLTKPKTLLEFGSGRSTNYLAEYAVKTGADFVSFEEHLYYCLKINFTLKLSFLPSNIVKYAPIKEGWYSKKKLGKYLPELGAIDFLLLDGPTKAGRGNRDSKTFYDCVFDSLKNVKVVVIDDVQRQQCEDIAMDLSQRLRLERFDILYGKDNKSALSIMVNLESSKKIDDLPDFIKGLLLKKTTLFVQGV